MYRKETKLTAFRDYAIILIGVICLIIGSIIPSLVWGGEEEAPEAKDFRCPYSQISDQSMCLSCHGRGYDFKKIKETNPHDMYDYPTFLTIREDSNGRYGYYELKTSISQYTPEQIDKALQYLNKHKINRLVVDIESPGGSVFSGWKVVAMLEEWAAAGNDLTTQVRSIAASAAFIIFCTADNRLISPTASLMGHELYTFTFLSLDTPSDSEHKAKILRHLQDTITVWLAGRVGMSKEDLAEKLKKREYWLNGAQAKREGWATGYTVVPPPEMEEYLINKVEKF